ncbi:MAG: chemotaxis protein CheW [Pseudobdellovibrionaceae bacterium]
MKDEKNRWIVFNIGGEIYGIRLLDAREVIEYQRPKFVPNMADYFLGVINIRGTIVGVIDLRKKLNVEPAKGKIRTPLLVCETPFGPVAAVVDKIEAVTFIAEDQIELNVPIKSKIQKEYLIGIAKHKEQMLVLVDLLKALSDELQTSKVAV